METRYSYILRFTLALTDLVLLNLSFFLGFYLSHKYGPGFNKDIYNHSLIACNLFWLFSTGVFRLYSEFAIQMPGTFYRSTLRTITMHTLLFLTYLLLTVHKHFPWQFLISSYAFIILGFLMSRFTGTSLLLLITKDNDISKDDIRHSLKRSSKHKAALMHSHKH
jgi:putative colanic acid biosynthesis UDP-glucose lipid carrier transferase